MNVESLAEEQILHITVLILEPPSHPYRFVLPGKSTTGEVWHRWK